MDYFVGEYEVGAGETDPFDRCRPSSLLGFLQDAATKHANLIGAGRGDLVSGINGIWVLSRIYYELGGPIGGGDNIEVKTWHRGAGGALFYRDFEIISGGNQIGHAVSAWVVLDFSSRRILRTTQLAPFNLKAGETASSGETLSRLKLPENMEPAGSHTVEYGELDINGHVNNTRYADFVCNALGMQKLEKGYIGKMQINYLSECLPDERISMHIGEKDGSFYVTGTKNDEKVCFEACAKQERR